MVIKDKDNSEYNAKMGIKKTDEFHLVEIGRCDNCKGLLKDYGFGIYKCTQCGHEMLTEFGRVKKYIEENGPSNAFNISQGTGVSMAKIDKFLRQGRIEIPEGSDSYISCEMCGNEIRYGRYCPQCALKQKKVSMTGFLPGEVGEVPKRAGKMRYMGEQNDYGRGKKGERR